MPVFCPAVVTCKDCILCNILGCNNGEVRLMNGSVPSLAVEGRVEVCYDNVYSTVCDDLWDERAAQVVCRDFSMSSGAALSGIASPYGSGNGSILLDNVVCTGTEDDLLHCAHNPLFENNCDHSEDAAVVCGGNLTFLYSRVVKPLLSGCLWIRYKIERISCPVEGGACILGGHTLEV